MAAKAGSGHRRRRRVVRPGTLRLSCAG